MTISLLPSLPGLTFPAKRTPEIKGTRLTTISGRNIWLPNYAYPLYHYEITYSLLRAAAAYTEYQQLVGFINTVKTTPGGYFYYDDPDDDTVTNQLIGVGNGSQTVFQSVRTLGGFVEPIFGPVVAGAVYKVNGGVVTATPSPTTGLVTFSVAPGNGLNVTWSGTYYWICEFEDELPEISRFMTQFYEVPSLKFKTVRP